MGSVAKRFIGRRAATAQGNAIWFLHDLAIGHLDMAGMLDAQRAIQDDGDMVYMGIDGCFWIIHSDVFDG